MKIGRGKPKGSGFERTMAKRLSLWLTQGEDATQLIRSVLSGGWSERNLLQVGDLAPNGAKGEEFRRHFAVECKHRNNFDLMHFFTQSPGENLAGWWRKLNQEIQDLDLGTKAPAPLLVIRANYRPVLAALPSPLIPKTRPYLQVHDVTNFGILLFSDFLTDPPEAYYGRFAEKADERFYW